MHMFQSWAYIITDITQLVEWIRERRGQVNTYDISNPSN